MMEQINVRIPSGTIGRLDRLKRSVEKSTGIKIKSRSALVRIILLDGISELEKKYAAINAAIILEHRKQRGEREQPRPIRSKPDS